MCDPVLCNKEFVCSFHGSWKEISKPLEFPNDSSIFVIHSDIESLCQWVIMVGPQIASAIKMTQNEGKTERHATWLESWGFEPPDKGWTSPPPGNDIPFPPEREGGLDMQFNHMADESIDHIYIIKQQ